MVFGTKARFVLRFGYIVWASAIFCGTTGAQMVTVNGASFTRTPLAPGSFASMFGTNLCHQTANAAWVAPGQLPTTLGGCSVMVNGTPAMMHYVSPSQVNFIVPAEAQAGDATVTMTNGSATQTGTMRIGTAGPGIFATNGMGMGTGAFLNGMTFQGGPFDMITNGQATQIAMYVTGLDLASTPQVSIAGVPATVTFYGPAPGYVGLQQINVMMPSGMTASGHLPVVIGQNGQVSNMTFMDVLPTTEVMQSMMGQFGGRMMSGAMSARHQMSGMAFNAANNTVLISDAADDAVRMISLDSKQTTATIAVPSGAAAHAVAVNPAGTYAAIALAERNSVMLIDLAHNNQTTVIATGYFPAALAFTSTSLVVANAASDTVSVIDPATAVVASTIQVGRGPMGLAAAGNLVVVANTEDSSVSLVDLGTGAATSVPLPAGTRPFKVGLAADGTRAVVTAPMTTALYIVDIANRTATAMQFDLGSVAGPGAVAVAGATAYIANMMTSNVTVADLSAMQVQRTIAVDPGPRSIAIDTAKNHLLVLSEAGGSIDVVDLASGAIVDRIAVDATQSPARWSMPFIVSMTPTSAKAGSTFTLTLTGTNFAGTSGIDFITTGGGSGGGMMGGGMMGNAFGRVDDNIKVSDVQVNSGGTQLSATVQIAPGATPGTRQVRLRTANVTMMGGMTSTVFTVSQ